MCQQKRLNIGREHNPETIGVKRVKAGAFMYLVLIWGKWNV